MVLSLATRWPSVGPSAWLLSSGFPGSRWLCLPYFLFFAPSLRCRRGSARQEVRAPAGAGRARDGLWRHGRTCLPPLAPRSSPCSGRRPCRRPGGSSGRRPGRIRRAAPRSRPRCRIAASGRCRHPCHTSSSSHLYRLPGPDRTRRDHDSLGAGKAALLRLGGHDRTRRDPLCELPGGVASRSPCASLRASFRASPRASLRAARRRRDPAPRLRFAGPPTCRHLYATSWSSRWFGSVPRRLPGLDRARRDRDRHRAGDTTPLLRTAAAPAPWTARLARGTSFPLRRIVHVDAGRHDMRTAPDHGRRPRGPLRPLVALSYTDTRAGRRLDRGALRAAASATSALMARLSRRRRSHQAPALPGLLAALAGSARAARRKSGFYECPRRNCRRQPTARRSEGVDDSQT